MKFFLDTANIDEIKKAVSWGVIDGVTTNPTLMAKEGKDVKETIQRIAEIVKGPVSVEGIGQTKEDMVIEAQEMNKWAENLVIKIPTTWEGMEAIKVLSKEGIKTNATLIFSPLQCVLAAKAGANYVSPFIGRLNDVGQDGTETLIEDTVTIFRKHGVQTEIIAASIRTPLDVLRVLKAGSHIVTIPFAVLEKMISHPLTEKGIGQFLADWNSRFSL
jgi:transaldolase